MSDTLPQQLWVALIVTPFSPLGTGTELVEANYTRIAFPLPLSNGVLPSLSIGAAAGWPMVAGWEVWDDQFAGNYLYGADLLWPMGPGGGFTLVFDDNGVASQFNPNAGS